MSPRAATPTPGRGTLTRRRFLRAALYGIPAVIGADAAWLEPSWIKVRHLRLASDRPTHRLVHFTDLHHKGNRRFLQQVVQKINAATPDFVCFTGDLIEESTHLPETLELLQQIKAPLYGVPGNHDYWSHADFSAIATAFAQTGGRWLLDESIHTADDKIYLIGCTCQKPQHPVLPPDRKHIALFHYPEWIRKLGPHPFTLSLAGHSHGGQVRLPFYGPLALPWGVGPYDLGLFATAAGPLYVGAGLGWFYLNLRFNCRPEITVIEI